MPFNFISPIEKAGFYSGNLPFFHGTLKRRKQALKRQILLCTVEYLNVLIEYRVGLRRVPVYIYKRRRCAPPIQAHVATTEPTEKHGKTGRGGRGIALNRLRLPRVFRRAVPDFLSAFQFAFGIFAIVSLLTCPMYSPSSQQPKESARMNFLPSSP